MQSDHQPSMPATTIPRAFPPSLSHWPLSCLAAAWLQYPRCHAGSHCCGFHDTPAPWHSYGCTVYDKAELYSGTARGQLAAAFLTIKRCILLHLLFHTHFGACSSPPLPPPRAPGTIMHKYLAGRMRAY